MRRRTEDGASAAEFGLLAAAIAAVIVITAFALGGFAQQSFSHTCAVAAADPSVTSDCN